MIERIEDLKVSEEQSSEATTSEQTEEIEVLEEEDAENDDVESEDDDDDEGWITPANVKQKKREMNGAEGDEDKQKRVAVACMTTDFAMQVRSLFVV